MANPPQSVSALPSEAAPQQPYEQRLQQLMTQAGWPSYRALATGAGISRSTLNHLRQGQIGKLQVTTLQRLSQALQVSPLDLMAQFSDSPAVADRPAVRAAMPGDATAESDPNDLRPRPEVSITALRQECERLQQQLTSQEQEIRQRVQREAILVIESWLILWPNVLRAAQQDETFLASKLIPLTRPWQALLKTWEVHPIGAVGEIADYDPHIHQPMGGILQPGAPVRVTHVGYWHGDRLLYRAKVSAAG
jgi:transcriptional regulator with XRE-family HTH domain